MSFLRGFVLTIFAVLLIAFLVLFQADNTVDNTALSPGYFDKAFDQNVTSASLANLASYLKDSVGDVGSDDMKKIVQDAIDVQWLQNDLPAFVKGSFAYFTTGEGKMPSISVKPMKDALKKAIDSQAGDAASLVEAQIGMDEMKDSFDPNVYFSKLYGKSANPMTGIGGIVSGTKDSFFLLISVTALLLFLIIAVIAFRPRSILRWGGACLIIAGLVCAIPALLALLFRSSLSAPVSAMIGSGSQTSLLFLQNWILSFAGGIAMFMLVQGCIAAFIGIAFLVAAGFIKSDGQKNPGHLIIRAMAAVVLLAAIPFSAYFIGRSYYTQHVKPFESVQEMHEKLTPGQAFDATMGGSLGELVFDQIK